MLKHTRTCSIHHQDERDVVKLTDSHTLSLKQLTLSHTSHTQIERDIDRTFPRHLQFEKVRQSPIFLLLLLG